MAELIHIAGPVITFGTRMRQRCSWCGALIDDQDLRNIGIREVDRLEERRGKPVEFDELSHWHGLVAIDGIVRWAVDEPEDGQAPERSCMVQLPDVDGPSAGVA